VFKMNKASWQRLSTRCILVLIYKL
jgi:hypothetical protein